MATNAGACPARYPRACAVGDVVQCGLLFVTREADEHGARQVSRVRAWRFGRGGCDGATAGAFLRPLSCGRGPGV